MGIEDSKRLPQRMGRLVKRVISVRSWRYVIRATRRGQADLVGKVAPRILGRDWKGSSIRFSQGDGGMK